jgi:RNA polymerase sigma-70 factor (ECF subfamily)
VRDFFNLAALQIRRELADLFRHHYGPEGHAAHHVTDPGKVDPAGDIDPLHERAEGRSGPLTQMQQREFHEHVQALPQQEREVFDLIYYQGLSREEVALTLNVAVRTVKRRWRSARLLLHGLMNSGPASAGPPSEDAAPDR